MPSSANHHSAKDIDTVEFRCVWDADWLVNIPDDFQNVGKNELQEIARRRLRTQKGLQIATEIVGLTCNFAEA